MSVLYIKEQGAYVTKSGDKIKVVKGNTKLLSFPVANLDSVSVIGNVQISTQALTFLLQSGIDISFFSFSGKLLGQANADSSKNIFLRFAQYDFYQNLEKRLEAARAIIHNKIENQIKMVRYQDYADDFTGEKEIVKMKELQKRLPECSTSNEILGIEGMCSNLYFTCFAHMIKSEIRFSGRNRRPPKDPINVILSLGYTFLTKEICSVLEAESFEVYLGFLHGIRYGRKSLALDIIEEFRQPVVDRFVIRGFNLRIFREEDFEIQEDGIVLMESGFKKFCREFEHWMNHEKREDQKSFRMAIRKQASVLKQSIIEGSIYHPYEWGG